MSDSIGIFNEESNDQHHNAVGIRELRVMIRVGLDPPPLRAFTAVGPWLNHAFFYELIYVVKQ